MPATITDPGDKKYPISDWTARPFLGTHIRYEKYDYDDETIEDIATKHGLTWQDLAFANWGVSDIAHVNWYLSRRHVAIGHPKTEVQVGGQTTFKLLKADKPNSIWVPRDRKLTSSNTARKRKPSPFAMGHAAPADTGEYWSQVNTLADQPVYEISLELGDMDALFDPMVPTGGAPTHVAHALGIQQRLQVAGYFYWPLGLSQARRNRYAEVAWKYFKKVHAWKDPQLSKDVYLDSSFTVASRTVSKNGVFTPNLKDVQVRFTLTEAVCERVIATADNNMLTFDRVTGVDDGDNFEIEGELQRHTLDDTYQLDGRTLRKEGAFSPYMAGKTIRFKVTESHQERTITAATANQISFDRLPELERGDRLRVAEVPMIEPTDDQAKRILRFEVRNNLLCVLLNNARFPEKAELLDGRLPSATPCVAVDARAGDEFGMIRLPGGYRYNWPRPGERVSSARRFGVPDVTDGDRQYDYYMADERFTYEQKFYRDNVFLARIPLLMKVERIRFDGKREPASGVSVYLKLVMPDPIASNPLRAPTPRRIEMDKTKDWELANAMPRKPGGTTDATWNTFMRAMANNAMGQPVGATRDNWITAHATGANWGGTRPARLRRAVTRAQARRAANAPPYTVGDTDPANPPTKGPAKFLHDTYDAADTAENDADNPQHPNGRSIYGGKRGIPVEGEDDGSGLKPGVFEVDISREGLHKKRDDDHPDYGTLPPATAVPDDIKAEHTHAVVAKTNEKGYAGVVFMPSRLGGDTYRLRAYVGPESVGFDGSTADGPVVETGTMTVWRNIRFCGYFRHKPPEQPGGASAASNAVKGVFSNTFNPPHPAPKAVRTFNEAWQYVPTASSFYTAELEHGRSHRWAKNKKKENVDRGTPAHYRPVDVDFPGLVDAFRFGYCEVILDVKDVTEISAADFRAGIQRLRDGARDTGECGKNLDYNYLVLDDPTSPWVITLRSLKDYNDNRPDKTAFPDDLVKKRLQGHPVLVAGLAGV